MERIGERVDALLKKNWAAGFADKGKDSGEVISLVEEIKSAIVYYQVSGNHVGGKPGLIRVGKLSQQQSMHDQIGKLRVRFFTYVFGSSS